MQQPKQKIKWMFWYTWATIALVVFVNRATPVAILYAIPMALLIYVLPVWLISRGYAYFFNRSSLVAPTATVEPPSKQQ